MEKITRSEHVERCKKRALEYVDAGDLTQAYTSMISDLDKHPETEHHPAAMLGMMLLINGQLDTPQKMREFINGFH